MLYIFFSSIIEIMKDIMIVYAARGKRVMEKLDFKSEMGNEVAVIMKPDQVLKG